MGASSSADRGIRQPQVASAGLGGACSIVGCGRNVCSEIPARDGATRAITVGRTSPLDARPSAETLLVTWDAAAARSLQDVGGTLKIADAGTDHNIPLDRSQIAAGHYEYTPAPGDVAVRLTVTEKGRPAQAEGCGRYDSRASASRAAVTATSRPSE